ncbi:MAG: PilZ domain-containing protein [Gemmataceae bacterium]|nr:PilZ domain-containing protein [Gemmataceae bacterium]
MALWKWLRGAGTVRSPFGLPFSGERRAATRFPSSRITSCRVITLPVNYTIQVAIRDISVGGLGLISSRPLQKGTFLAITLEGANDRSRRLRAHVVHCTEQVRGEWNVGCMLSGELSHEELEAFL